MHAAVKEMLALGGFRWDDNSKTMKASEHVWRDVLKTRKHLRQYKGKSLGFYQEISQLVGEDHAEGVQGSTPVMTTGNMAAANEAQVDPLGEDIHLEDWSPRNINSQIPLPMHAPMSTGPSGAYAQPQRQHTQSLTTGLHN
ncbi:hypothetical protein FRX31_025072 [Thalictrum thalictroides]|uniref:Myb/SANT-like domain-containing protein n=1 Tax=Thalictrum thalictroides TaxID=46969 RepID=A0A7J6VKP6_THATH|nr:hypothetical protein FRX31_025072 [Thalictrum thalictroides]